MINVTEEKIKSRAYININPNVPDYKTRRLYSAIEECQRIRKSSSRIGDIYKFADHDTKVDNAWSSILYYIVSSHNREETLKYLAWNLLEYGECIKTFVDKILDLMVHYNCSGETIKWILEQGANPNTQAQPFNIGLTIMARAANTFIDDYRSHYFNDPDPEIFYWLIIYGGELSINPEFDGRSWDKGFYIYHYSNIVDVLKIQKCIMHKFLPCSCQKFIDETEKEQNNKTRALKAFEALKALNRAVARMREEVVKYCLILPPLLNICYSYLCWSK